MFAQIALYELKYRFTRLSTHIYFGIFFVLAFLLGLAVSGVFESFDAAVMGAGGNTKANSPFIVMGMISSFSFFGVVITASFMGQAVYRDYEHNMHGLIFTTPVTKFDYLGGRFAGALVANLYVFLSFAPALMLAFALPLADRALVGPFRLAAYVQPYLVLVLPNLLFTGALFFALAAFTRKMLPNYVGGVVLLLGYSLAGTLIGDVEYEAVAALVDPFGSYASQFATQYWTPAEQNTQLLPLTGYVLYNRLIWTAVGLAIFGLVYARFSRTHAGAEWRLRRARAGAAGEAAERAVIDTHALPAMRQDFTPRLRLEQLASIARREFAAVVRNVYFYVLLAVAVLLLAITTVVSGSLFGTPTYPVTAQMTTLLQGSFSLMILVIITFYAGELVWRERDLKAQQIHDALPLPTWLPFAAKLAALGLVCAALMAFMMVCGVVIQAAKGYFRFEFGLYLTQLFGVQLVDYLLLCVLALCVHTVVNQKYLGHFVMVLYYVVSIFIDEFGFEHNLYVYASDTGIPYSDMNGYGHFLFPFTLFKLYWAAFAVVLAALTNLLWVRGQEANVRWRARLARRRATRPVLAELGLALLVFAGLGGYIFYNTNVLNTYQTKQEREARTADYEKTYKRYEGIPQPRITAVSLEVDIFPEARDAAVRGRYVLTNKTAVPVDSVHVLLPREVEIRALAFDSPHRRVLADEEHGYYVYALDAPLAPGDSLGLAFDLAYVTRGFPNSGSNTQLVYNGTFFNSYLMPRIGYDAGNELSDDDTRRKHGLAPKERMAALDDSLARMNTYIAHDSDWITFEATVSTSPDQVALAPGYLQREWTADGRRYFHYAMDAPILGFYAFLSARYDVRRDAWTAPDGREVVIEVYHHPAHTFNVDRMIDAVKKSLDYFTAAFGPYQHRQVRILEFPRYASFAQSFPNTIPYSESIGFIARVEDEDDVDYPFYVTAHEVAHQWWAHQVIGGAVQGSTLMSETLSQYSALMVMKREYGEDQMKRFLSYELDQYLQGRAFERKKEQPLLTVENQAYIHYNKGSLVMYALQDYIGEDTLNAALARYLRDVAYEEPPYTNAREFLGYVRAATPDSLQYLVTDLFERITLYENRVTAATYREREGGRYEVELALDLRKLQADSLGAETEVPMDDWLDVGVFGEVEQEGETEEVPLYFARHRLASGADTLRLTVDRLPVRAGVDPYFKLVDRHKNDNVKKLSKKE